jgi:type IV fimbrial biogenesis protein FimT
MPRRRSTRGLTLIELVIALAVLAILSALAWPSVGARLERQRVLTAAQMLAADLADARFEAAQRGQTLHVQVNPGPAWCWAVARTDTCPCGTPAAACSLRSVPNAEHPGVLMIEGHAVTLLPTGDTEGRHAATLSSRRGEQLRVELSALGRPRVCAVSSTWKEVPAC